MLPTISIRTKTILLGLFLISYSSQVKSTNIEASISEDFNLTSSGNLNQKFLGEMVFETSTEMINNKIEYSILKLQLEGETEDMQHSIEFFISNENGVGNIPLGSYSVAKDDNGYLNYYDGLFGFANISALGEIPFFAQSGEIEIEHIDAKTAKGFVNVLLSNAEGKKIHLEGDFIASN